MNLRTVSLPDLAAERPVAKTREERVTCGFVAGVPRFWLPVLLGLKSCQSALQAVWGTSITVNPSAPAPPPKKKKKALWRSCRDTPVQSRVRPLSSSAGSATPRRRCRRASPVRAIKAGHWSMRCSCVWSCVGCSLRAAHWSRKVAL